MKDDRTTSEMHRKKQISQLGWNDRTPGYKAGPGLVGFLGCRHTTTTSIVGRKGSAQFTVYSPSPGETKQELEEDGNLESGQKQRP